MKRLILLLLAAGVAFGQATGNTTIQPDIFIPFTLNSATSFPLTPTANGPGDNRTKGAAAWTMTYQCSGFTGVSMQVDSGSSTSTTVSFGAFAGTTQMGFANPVMSDTGGTTELVNSTASISWVRVTLSASGSGTCTGVLYGFRNSSAAVTGGGGGTGCPAGSVGSIQYDNSGMCGGDSNSVQLWDFHMSIVDPQTLTISLGYIAGMVWPAVTAGLSPGVGDGSGLVFYANFGDGTIHAYPDGMVDITKVSGLTVDPDMTLFDSSYNNAYIGEAFLATDTFDSVMDFRNINGFSLVTTVSSPNSSISVTSVGGGGLVGVDVNAGANIPWTGAQNFSGATSFVMRTIAFASLGTPANAQQVYCSDCTVTSGSDDTCLGSGSGAQAVRINGAWKCGI